MIHLKRLLRLTKELKHPDASKRRSAADALSGGDERAIYPLMRALKDENPGVQDAAMRSLISLGGEVTAYMVLPLLREDSFLRNTAIIILKEIGLPVVPLLRPLIKDKDHDVRKFALDLLCDIKHCDYPSEIAFVLESDPNPNVRASAAKAIGIVQFGEGVTQLIKALQDDEWVCFSALESLALLKDESSIEAVSSLLKSPSDALRIAAVETLGSIGTSQ
ncbi:MAG TPA: hypothetical protein DCP92_06910, partial [Nitrospiraceae bacterium]|nr:hypothetical protein [Nitrospiraceae bacterium]